MKYRSLIGGFVLLLISLAGTLRAQVDTPGVPILISPQVNEVAKFPEITFIWHSSSNAIWYTFTITRDSAGQSQVYNNNSLKDTMISLSGFPVGKEYWWKVYASDGTILTPPSEIRPFQTSSIKGITVTHLSPKYDTTKVDTIVTLLWHSLPQTDKYIVQLSLDPSFGQITSSDTVSDTMKVYNELSLYSEYYWRVRPLVADSTGIWSSSWRFRTRVGPVGKVFLATPVDSALFYVVDSNSTYRNFMWSYVFSASMYELQISYSRLFDSLVVDDTTNSLIKLPFENATYYWRVRAYNELGWGEWSDRRQFSHSIFNSVESDVTNDIIVFPNPAVHSATIRGNSLTPGARIQLVNILGEVLKREEVSIRNDETVLLLDDIPAGTYYLLIKTNNGKHKMAKVIK